MNNTNISLFLVLAVAVGFLAFQGNRTVDILNEEISLIREEIDSESDPVDKIFALNDCRIESNVKAGIDEFYPGESPHRETAVCREDEIVISGGCEMVGLRGMYRDFGGVQNVGYIASYPNEEENGWTCGFYGGFGADMDEEGRISLLRETGTWDINSYAVCCPASR